MELTPKRLHLFQGYGVELEYMIVDKKTLDVRPFSERVLVEDGKVVEEVEAGETAWSNELVGHVIELKSNGPRLDLVTLHKKLHSDVLTINKSLDNSGACLMPTAMHPWMNPLSETVLWAHGHNEIYSLYDKIFDCKGHGWSNLQSVHINLPFYDDEEFGRLHTAIRFLLPIIPVLTASSPVIEGRKAEFLDARLHTYEGNQARIPVLTGKVIPEAVFSKYGYNKAIYEPIAEAIAPYDPDKIMKPVWLNSRGAIARFDRGAIEIRIVDIQECPKADLALVALITSALKLLVSEKLISFEKQKVFETPILYRIYRKAVRDGGACLIEDPDYLNAFGFKTPTKSVEIWKKLVEEAFKTYPTELNPWEDEIRTILTQGNLSQRILRRMGGDITREKLFDVYSELVNCLASDTQFAP